MRICVLGAGAWGAALAKVLHENGNSVVLWDINTALLAELQQGRSERLLPGVTLPTDWKTEPDFAKAAGGREVLVMAIPSQFFREVAVKLKGHPGVFVSVTKGIEYETGETMSRILRELAPADRVAALSGPSFAREVGPGAFSSPGISDLPQHRRAGRGIRRRVEKRHRHRRRRG